MSSRTRRLSLLLLAALVITACRATGPRITQAPEPLRTPNASDFRRVEAREALDVFVALLAADDRAFRIDEEATISTPVGGLRATYRMDVFGEDMEADLRFSGAGAEATRIRFILVGDGLWAREGSAGWKKVPRSSLAASDELEVLVAGIVPRHLDYKGEKQVDGKTLFQFRGRTPIAYVSSTAEFPGSINDLEVSILEDGTPVTVTVEYSGIYQLIPSVQGRITVDATMSFSRVGKPVQIEPPK